jgi:hypothetical protein
MQQFTEMLTILCNVKKSEELASKESMEQAKELQNNQEKLKKIKNIEAMPENTPNIIICRRYTSTKNTDLMILKENIPDIMTAITYLDNPADIKRYLIPSRENIVFV